LRCEFSSDELDVQIAELPAYASEDFLVSLGAEILHAIPALAPSPQFPTDREVLMMVSKIGTHLAEERRGRAAE
jgi:hypothetical protein